MEPEVREKIETTVREILEESDINEVTEYKIRKLASEKLGVNLSEAKYKAFVKEVVTSFLEELRAKQEEEEEEEEEAAADDDDKGKNKQEYDDDGDLIVCRLNDKRKVTIQEFRGKTLVSVREYYKKDGKELPTSKEMPSFWD
ncbi:hypothetical protein SLEP1_g47692 [Rubroshorea leprosula]|uniref:DEK-C domain-containing protein n=1 Tax=Rubroshorea leprosula TaxID=152421 RepID=A0AAV5LRF3_9ROSI|nr:hypothetical protein SLEP1_g47692 [Rubroshorea leprosula]